jgi:hypothetical protein
MLRVHPLQPVTLSLLDLSGDLSDAESCDSFCQVTPLNLPDSEDEPCTPLSSKPPVFPKMTPRQDRVQSEPLLVTRKGGPTVPQPMPVLDEFE